MDNMRQHQTDNGPNHSEAFQNVKALKFSKFSDVVADLLQAPPSLATHMFSQRAAHRKEEKATAESGDFRQDPLEFGHPKQPFRPRDTYYSMKCETIPKAGQGSM